MSGRGRRDVETPVDADLARLLRVIVLFTATACGAAGLLYVGWAAALAAPMVALAAWLRVEEAKHPELAGKVSGQWWRHAALYGVVVGGASAVVAAVVMGRGA